ncbi:3'-5' exonuclease [Hoylesella shahii]|jgi:DNA polymerase III epsilon subunit-like protein|uniref:3'-5' exonuclease n=1 Tax=Hoylesella shahii TaxID=228603 RepID=UPI0020638C46|nr:3'-5' exonuclease [Hoylesella shahii]DAV47224.1 MAG TPA: REP HELICASE [Caudoviricetes sp.]
MIYEIKDVLFFDVETTGVPEKGLKWDVDFDKFPFVVQFAWLKDGVLKKHLIKPITPKGIAFEIPKETTEIHGVSTELAMREGRLFEDVVQEFVQDCTASPLICAHNIYFDTSIIKANIMRYLGKEYYDSKVDGALFKGKRIDTMMKTMKFVGATFPNSSRIKFPTLEELYARCFDGKKFGAHDAGEDVKALAECLPIIVELGFVKLEQKEYNEDGTQKKSTTKKSSSISKTKIVKAKGLFDDADKNAKKVVSSSENVTEEKPNNPLLQGESLWGEDKF